jgi:hypothetical protein
MRPGMDVLQDVVAQGGRAEQCSMKRARKRKDTDNFLVTYNSINTQI